LYSRSY